MSISIRQVSHLNCLNVPYDEYLPLHLQHTIEIVELDMHCNTAD